MGTTTTAALQKPTKPSGWKGKKGDSYWHKSTTFGVHSMCTDCGRESRGWASDNDRKFHRAECPRVAGPRKEWKGYVDATGKACVHRLTTENASCHETREAALLALDAELAAQQDVLRQQREQVAALMVADDKAGQ